MAPVINPEELYRRQVAQFCESLLVVRGLSENTVAAYQSDLGFFFDFVAKPVEGVTERDVLGFMAVQGRSQKPATQARRLAAIKTFFAFAVTRQWRADHPALNIARPKKTETLPKALSEREVSRLLEAPVGQTPPEVRLRLILQLLYACGMRVSELAGLTLADVAEGEGVVLRVTGKGDKTRLVPLGDTAGETLRQYMREARPHLPGTQGPWLLPGPSGQRPLTRQRLFQLVQAAGERVQVKVHPHQLRHTFATHLVNNDADLRAVQVMLGHASLNTTQVYTKVADRRVREVLERFHPLSEMGRKKG